MWKQLRSIQKSDSRKYNNPSSKFTKHYPRFPISNNRESTRESSTISQAGQSIFEKGESSPPPYSSSILSSTFRVLQFSTLSASIYSGFRLVFRYLARSRRSDCIRKGWPRVTGKENQTRGYVIPSLKMDQSRSSRKIFHLRI